MDENLEALQSALPRLAEGVLVTLQLILGGAALAFVIAVILGLTARHHNTLLRGTARALIEFFRGTSLVVQLFWLFFVLPQLGVTLPALFTGIVALGLNYGAYGAEVVRGAINSVPKGQWEAAVALSLPPRRRMSHVVWPQAWAIMIPSLSNLAIMLVKGTAVAIIVFLQDITFVTNELRQQTGDTFFAYGVGMVIYFLIAYVIVVTANAAEVRAKHRLGTGPPLRDIFRVRTPARQNSGVA